jgi:hypothetical protein
MEKIIKTVYTTFYQKTIGVSYREQIIITTTTVAFILGVIIPLFSALLMGT